MSNPKVLVLLSGPLAVGKTSVREQLVTRHGFDYVRSGQYLLEMKKRNALDSERRGLQDLGDELDRNSDFRWLLEDVAIPGFEANSHCTCWLVDAVRKPKQIEHFRNAYHSAVKHVHLTAPEIVLKARYETRQEKRGEGADQTSYENAIAHDNEIASRGLITIADLILDTSTMTPEEIATQVIAAQKLAL